MDVQWISKLRPAVMASMKFENLSQKALRSSHPSGSSALNLRSTSPLETPWSPLFKAFKGF